ncbi:hypothetical protein KCU99_g6749, partial [Aureobasidium melanogenum]
MARLTELPPEVRLKIYDLLLVDPIRDGLRITMTFDPLDNNKMAWGRASCAQTEQPHKEGHSAEPCCVDVPPCTLHHLDFTDLWSLARTSRILYVEATPTIYSNADLVYSSDKLTSDPSMQGCLLAFAPLSRYFEEHSLTTKAMLDSLVIREKFATMSARDMKLVVDIVNFHLPNLRVFGYHVSEDAASSPSSRRRDSRRSFSRTFSTLQPLACLRAKIRPFLYLPVPAGFILNKASSRLTSNTKKGFYGDCFMKFIDERVKGRRAMHDYHEAALQHGHYLQATLALRSAATTNKQVIEETSLIEKNLVRMQPHADKERAFRKMNQYTRRFK